MKLEVISGKAKLCFNIEDVILIRLMGLEIQIVLKYQTVTSIQYYTAAEAEKGYILIRDKVWPQ